MAVALAQAIVHKARTSFDTTTTVVINGVAAGNTLVVAIAGYHGQARTPAVSGSSPANTWASAVLGSGDANSHLTIYYAMNVASGNTTITLQWSPGTLSGEMEADVLELTGVGTSGVLDVTPTFTTGSSAAPAIASGALNHTDEIIVAMASHVGGDTTWAHDSGGGYTLISENEASSGGQTYSSQYKIVSSASSDTADWALGTSQSWWAILASFRGSGAAITFEQLHYRWRNDNGDETTATFAAAEDTAP